MRKAVVAIALLFASLTLAVAQGALPPVTVTPEQFNLWSLNSQGANTYTFAGTNCQNYPQTNGQVGAYFVFGPTANPYPVLIRDANPSNSEVVTPSSTSNVQGSCGFSASPSNSHISFTVSSGTAGIQDAVGTLGSTATPAYPWTVLLTRATYQAVAGLPGSKSVAGIIGALKGSVNVQLEDITTAPHTFYVWNGTAYVAAGGATTPPTLAVSGAGAGTSPSGASIVGSSSAGTVTFTTGTTPSASSAVFTLTYPSVANGGPNYAKACTFTSIGANAYTTGTSATTGTPEVVTFTSSSTALTASTQYIFNYHCN